jgi:hypothetical protein
MFRIVDSINDEMGNVGNDDIGFSETGLKRILPLIGFEDMDDIDDEAFDAWG